MVYFTFLFHLYLICVSQPFSHLLSTSLLSFLHLLYLMYYFFCILFCFISIISLVLDVQFLFFISFIPDAPLTISFAFISTIADIYFLFSTSVLLDALVFFISKHILFHLYLMFHLLISFHLYLMFLLCYIFIFYSIPPKHFLQAVCGSSLFSKFYKILYSKGLFILLRQFILP